MDNLEITGDNLGSEENLIGDAPEITSDNLSNALEITEDNLTESPGDPPEITKVHHQKLTRADIAQREGVAKKTVEAWAKRGRLEAKGYIATGFKGQASLYRYDPDKDTRR